MTEYILNQIKPVTLQPKDS